MKIMLDKGAYMPVRGHSTDAGLDIRAKEDFIIPARASVTTDTGVHVELPRNTTGFLKSKSGLNIYHDITSEGVIDVGYTGSIRVKLFNHGNAPFRVKAGDKISQLVILPIVIPKRLKLVKSFKKTERGDNGFGSTGK